MITKFKLFEQLTFDDIVEPRPLYNLGDRVYYHGYYRDHHGYYTITKVNHLIHMEQPEQGDTGWRYNLRTNAGKLISWAWEISLSLTEEEGRRKDKEYHERKERTRELMKDIDPYGEEIWENKSDIDPYGEEDWNELEHEDIKKIFIDFLKGESAFDGFISQLEIRDFNILLDPPRHAIPAAFYWPDSVEGGEYWRDISIEWNKICDDNNI